MTKGILIEQVTDEVKHEIVNSLSIRLKKFKREKTTNSNKSQEEINIIDEILKLIENFEKEKDEIKKENIYNKLLKINNIGVNNDLINKLKTSFLKKKSNTQNINRNTDLSIQ